jgi:hypothetical protein
MLLRNTGIYLQVLTAFNQEDQHRHHRTENLKCHVVLTGVLSAMGSDKTSQNQYVGWTHAGCVVETTYVEDTCAFRTEVNERVNYPS